MEEGKSRVRSVSLLAGNFGKLPPQAVDLEETVLGAILLESKCLPLVVALLHTSDVFYEDVHKMIYEAVLDLHKAIKPIDIATVTAQLKKNGNLDNVGGPFFITQLTNRVASSANIEFHCAIIIEAFLKREAIRIASTMIKEGYEDTSDAFDVIGRGAIELSNLVGKHIGVGEEDTRSIAMRVMGDAIAYSTSKTKKIVTGYRDLDTRIVNLRAGNLIIVAARPGMGKTALALCIANNVVFDQKYPVAFFSLEMGRDELVTRLISLRSGIDSKRIESWKSLAYEEHKKIEAVIEELNNSGLHIEDAGGISITDLRNRAIYLKNKYGIKMIVVDYLQLMKGTGGKGQNREAEISEISRGLKALAKELQLPIIALSQLARETEKRGGDKKPQLIDLRESGAIEQDADQVWFVYRAEYYGKKFDAENNSLSGKAEIIIAKMRNGGLAVVVLNWIARLTKFESEYQAEQKDFPSDTNTITPEEDAF